MILSQTATYALRAALCLADHGNRMVPLRVDDIAEQLDVPRNYLSKILHALAKSGVSGLDAGSGRRLPPHRAGAGHDSLGAVVEQFDDAARGVRVPSDVTSAATPTPVPPP